MDVPEIPPRYPLELFLRVARFSLERMNIVRRLPGLTRRAACNREHARRGRQSLLPGPALESEFPLSKAGLYVVLSVYERAGDDKGSLDSSGIAVVVAGLRGSDDDIAWTIEEQGVSPLGRNLDST